MNPMRPPPPPPKYGLLSLFINFIQKIKIIFPDPPSTQHIKHEGSLVLGPLNINQWILMCHDFHHCNQIFGYVSQTPLFNHLIKSTTAWRNWIWVDVHVCVYYSSVSGAIVQRDTWVCVGIPQGRGGQGVWCDCGGRGEWKTTQV